MKTKIRYFKIVLKTGKIDYVCGEYLADAIQSFGYSIQQIASSEEK